MDRETKSPGYFTADLGDGKGDVAAELRLIVRCVEIVHTVRNVKPANTVVRIIGDVVKLVK